MSSKKKTSKKQYKPTAEGNEMLKIMLSNRVPGIPGLRNDNNVRKTYTIIYKNNPNFDMMSKENTIRYIIQKGVHDGVNN